MRDTRERILDVMDQKVWCRIMVGDLGEQEMPFVWEAQRTVLRGRPITFGPYPENRIIPSTLQIWVKIGDLLPGSPADTPQAVTIDLNRLPLMAGDTVTIDGLRIVVS